MTEPLRRSQRAVKRVDYAEADRLMPKEQGYDDTNENEDDDFKASSSEDDESSEECTSGESEHEDSEPETKSKPKRAKPAELVNGG